MSNIENLMFEHLKKIQAEQTASRERDAEIMGRLAETSLSNEKRSNTVSAAVGAGQGKQKRPRLTGAFCRAGVPLR